MSDPLPPFFFSRLPPLSLPAEVPALSHPVGVPPLSHPLEIPALPRPLEEREEGGEHPKRRKTSFLILEHRKFRAKDVQFEEEAERVAALFARSYSSMLSSQGFGERPEKHSILLPPSLTDQAKVLAFTQWILRQDGDASEYILSLGAESLFIQDEQVGKIQSILKRTFSADAVGKIAALESHLNSAGEKIRLLEKEECTSLETILTRLSRIKEGGKTSATKTIPKEKEALRKEVLHILFQLGESVRVLRGSETRLTKKLTEEKKKKLSLHNKYAELHALHLEEKKKTSSLEKQRENAEKRAQIFREKSEALTKANAHLQSLVHDSQEEITSCLEEVEKKKAELREERDLRSRLEKRRTPFTLLLKPKKVTEESP